MDDWIKDMAGFPRPDRVRRETVLLDGEWDFRFDRLDVGRAAGWWKGGGRWPMKIRVPYCVESELSGVAKKMAPGVVWYRREFDAPDFSREGKILLLHFGAADYRADAWLNGRYLGGHSGGYAPFSFDIGGTALQTGNELVVRVEDTIDPRIPRGKQSFTGFPFMIFYTPVTGIWQSVYLETAGRAFVKDFRLKADPASGEVGIACELSGNIGVGMVVRARIKGPGGQETDTAASVERQGAVISEVEIKAVVPSPRTWSPGSPELYRLELSVELAGGTLVDRLESYFGFRSFEVSGEDILLNGEPVYQKMMLNQGYFPRGHYTPEDPDMFRRDVEQALEMGFNGVRMHQKIENPKFLFWCDVLGLLVWQDIPAGYMPSVKLRRALARQLEEAVARDRNHPSVVVWVPFNETWGIHDILVSERARQYVRDTVARLHALDPSRPVIDNSGFEHVDTDILDLHHYLGSVEDCERYYAELRNPGRLRFTLPNVVRRLNVAKEAASPLAPGVEMEGKPLFISEYGGFGFYRAEEKSLLENFEEYTLAIARDDLFKGYCYTQQYDTEQEQNGLLTFDREPKLPAEQIRAVNDKVDEIVDGR